MNSNLKQLFDNSRQELLDMGLRGNTLLSLGRGAKVLEIVDEKSSSVFDALVEQGKTMAFLAAPEVLRKSQDEQEPKKTVSLEELTAHLEQKKGESRHNDTGLQTQLFSKPLDTRLLKLSTEAITFVQEQGVDLLYLATGFLKWYEDDSSDKARFAPLALVPVEIFRADVGDTYKIRYTEAELGTNLTLAAKLKMEFGLQLPELVEQEDGYDLEEYFVQVSQAVAKEKRWSVVADKIALSFFSFGKFQMYQDLSDDAWPEGQKPSQSSLIEKLFSNGFEDDGALLDATPMDVNRAEDIQLVLDSDSSQTEAVLAAKSGANLVIQGPPGTGKSQTITNIISQALADDKKILFVAEKMAALDVVKRRLDNCNIGDAVLELHSHKANKKAVLSSLESTLMQHAPVSPERSEDIDKLVQLRNKLDDYCTVVNSPIEQTGFSYHDALGFALQLEGVLENQQVEIDALPNMDFDLKVWDSSYYKLALGKISEVVDYLIEHHTPILNLFSSTQLTDYSPADDKQATQLAEQLINLQQEIIQGVQKLHSQAGCESELKTFGDVINAYRSLNLVASRPEFDGVDTEQEVWQKKGDSILEFATQGITLQEQKTQLLSHFIEPAIDHDWLAIRGVLMTTGQKWWRFLSGDFRRAKNTYSGMCVNGIQGRASDWLENIDTVLEYKTAQKAFIDSAQLAIKTIGDNFKNESTDWKAVFAPLQWVHQCHQGLKEGQIDPQLSQYLNPSLELAVSAQQLTDLTEQLAQRDKMIAQLSSALSMDCQSFTDRLAELEIDAVEAIGQDVKKLYPLTRFNRLKQQLEEFGLTEWVSLAFVWQQNAEALRDGFKYTFFNDLVNKQYQTHDEIRYFDRVEHEKQIEQFTAIDAQLFNYTQEGLVKQLFDKLPNPLARGEVETLRREFNKKRRQMPIRRLLNKSGRVIQQIKPVFMMSPMSIATYLEPGVVDFDLVIFDEASQVKVADALGALLRGKQVIVVGDTKQMPPTNFFGKQFVADDEDAEESVTADMESILGMFLASGTPERMLKWHYRSRHESLIAVSNQEFYDNQLMIFPSSGINPQAKGLNFNHLPDTTYDRGGSRSNIGEAQAVAAAVMEHARNVPHQTLGVVAFSTAQRDAIILEVDRLRKANSDLEHFFAEHPEGEDFFVKNLENVQGDERDTIYISIGYGKTTEGRLPMSFGPLNSEGGERRLNVLISRARMCMDVFCNFKAEEMPTSDASPFGVRSLKNFLHFADTGDLVKREETGKMPDSPFEEEVISSICSLGYQVEPQVGCAGFYIDIAVRDPNKPGRYMLAVECDGATYHSSKSARDRDRIRQGVLEGLGWRFHRIWSTDWFRNRHQETQRLDDAIKASIAYYAEYDAKPTQVSAPKPKAKASIDRVLVDHQASVTQYQMCDTQSLQLNERMAIHDLNTRELAVDIETILEVESPIHQKQLVIRLLSAVGSTRAGARINRAIDDALGLLSREDKVLFDGEFAMLSSKVEVVVRNRAVLPSNERKFDLIYDGELAQAAVDTINDTYSISNDDLIKSVTEVLGFSVTSKAMKERVQVVLDQLELEQKFEKTGDTYKAL